MMHPARQAYVEETEDTDMGGISYADLRKSFSKPVLFDAY